MDRKGIIELARKCQQSDFNRGHDTWFSMSTQDLEAFFKEAAEYGFDTCRDSVCNALVTSSAELLLEGDESGASLFAGMSEITSQIKLSEFKE